MRLVLVIVIACLAAAVGCSRQPPEATPVVLSPPTTRTQTAQERARDLLRSADLELHDLRELRSRASGDDVRDAVDRQMAAIAMHRDALQTDLASHYGRHDDARLHADSANLERSLSAGAAAEMQPTAPGPTQTAPASHP